jgi:hypothetical protein
VALIIISLELPTSLVCEGTPSTKLFSKIELGASGEIEIKASDSTPPMEAVTLPNSSPGPTFDEVPELYLTVALPFTVFTTVSKPRSVSSEATK